MKFFVWFFALTLFVSCTSSSNDSENAALVDELTKIEHIDELHSVLDKLGDATTKLNSESGNFEVTFPVGQMPKKDTIEFTFKKPIQLHRDFIAVKDKTHANQSYAVAHARIEGVSTPEEIDALFSAYLNYLLMQDPAQLDAEYMGNEDIMKGTLYYLEEDKSHLMLEFRLIFTNNTFYVLEVKSLNSRTRNAAKRQFLDSFVVLGG